MIDLQKICVEENIKVAEAIRKLDAAGERILLVTNKRKLTGIVTDGDVRRWILKNGSFEANVNEMMHREPKVVQQGEKKKAKEIMLSMHLQAVPIVDENNMPVDIVFLRDFLNTDVLVYDNIDIPVVIMAGGKGSRLYPYTNVLPKPLIPIGGTTILERIIQSFQKNGCESFWLTLNYKKNLIKAYMDEKETDYSIHYVEEEDFWGTCGSIRLLENKINGTFFVSNCDVLLDIDYAELLHYHLENKNEITMVTSLKYMQLPYGVVEMENGGTVKKLSEKPEFNYNINTGIYVMESTVMRDIPASKLFHMTDLVNKLLSENRRVGAYPITENCWRDMGEINEMYKMIDSFS